jgi:hypothetical protein
MKLWILTNFDQQAPSYTLLQGKINFHQKRIRKLNFAQKKNSVDFAIV